ncbi:serine threonine kinase [Fusarium heterosporum]|uniref:Serine threonine kinase n=1 Tax=Fusarium heterosporum TaxID=42747 RepID=A0A8H5X1A4_FUSHE|nr:serine threonine kinase [Fusarium heterosporum]
MFYSRLSLAFVVSLSLFTNTHAFSSDGEGGFPDFITSWRTFQYWQEIRDQSPVFDVPSSEGVLKGQWANKAKKLNWNCYNLQVTDEISSTDVIVAKAILTTTNDQGEEQTETVVSKRSYGERKAIIYGANLQKGLSHDNILPINHVIDASQTDGREGAPVRVYGFAIMPYVEAGSLESNYGNYADQGAINGAFKQMLSAVSAVSAAGIIHRDLKPENFLVDGDTLKLMDFDQARKIDTTAQTDVGTPSYVAPEIVTVKDYTTKADTFSMGISFLVMSEPDLRNSDNRFQLWKDLIEPEQGYFQPTSGRVEQILKDRNYGVFNGNDGLLKVIAKALCAADERYTPAEFETAFAGAV